jgi:hypothetical protein
MRNAVFFLTTLEKLEIIQFFFFYFRFEAFLTSKKIPRNDVIGRPL